MNGLGIFRDFLGTDWTAEDTSDFEEHRIIQVCVITVWRIIIDTLRYTMILIYVNASKLSRHNPLRPFSRPVVATKILALLQLLLADCHSISYGIY